MILWLRLQLQLSKPKVKTESILFNLIMKRTFSAMARCFLPKYIFGSSASYSCPSPFTSQISHGSPWCSFSQVFGARGSRCNWSRVISQHATSPVLSLIKSYCPHSLCHPLCHCCVCVFVYAGLRVQPLEVSYCLFPVTDLKTKGCHCGRTTWTKWMHFLWSRKHLLCMLSSVCTECEDTL